jgi:phosphoribosylformylglycinamidine synthase
LTIRSIDPDPRGAAISSAAEQLGTPLDTSGVAIADLVFVEGDLDQQALESLHEFLVDPLLQVGTWSVPAEPGV